MTGKELKELVDNCNNQCSQCQLFRPNQKHKCVKVWCEAWQQWANNEHKVFNEVLSEEQKQI